MSVVLRFPVPGDEPVWRDAVLRSASHLHEYSPMNPDGFPRLVEQSLSGDAFVSFLVWDGDDGGLVGTVTFASISRGIFLNAMLGYAAFLPYAGTGRMSAAVRTAVGKAFAPLESGGLGLHRLEAHVQPGNERSAALLRRMGFRYEGFAPRLLRVHGQWRDHERYAVTVEEWPSPAS
ncbi:GNAT family N-acetyltransferase [Streptomyces vinaceus]